MAKRRPKHAHAKRSHGRKHYGARGRHEERRRHRRRHTVINPFNVRRLSGSIMPALIGAGGAIGTDVAMAYASPYLPASLQSGWLNILARAGAALAVGYVAGKVSSRQVGHEVAAGGLIVVAYSALKQALAPTLGQSIKGLSGLADFGDYRPSQIPYGNQAAAMMGSTMGAYMQPRLGAYMQPRLGAYMNPATILSPGMSPIAAKQRAMAGFGNFGSYDSDSM